MIPFHLKVLGPPLLRGPHGDPIRFRTRKHLGLLIFLAVERSFPHRRDRLASLLWPRVGIAEARHSLATGLSLLRHILKADSFETDRETVRLIPGRVLTDLQTVRSDTVGDIDGVLSGPFLEDFVIGDVPDYQIWSDSQRMLHMPRIEALLVDIIDTCRRRGDADRMTHFANVLQRFDHLSEAAARAHLEARTMSGDRLGALRAYDLWRDSLFSELGASPARYLERIATRLRHDGIGSDTSSVRVASTIPRNECPEDDFVGRNEEFRECYSLWDNVRNNQPSHVLIRGESGIGKSAFADRLAKAFALEGATTIRVQCHPREQSLEYGVIVEVVDKLLTLSGASATPPDKLAEIGKTIPSVSKLYPSLPSCQTNREDHGHIRLIDSVVALIEAISSEQPLVVIIDDVHLADATSQSLLHLLLRHLRGIPTMIILTQCDRDTLSLDGSSVWGDSVSATQLHTVSLGPLRPKEVEAFIRATIGPSKYVSQVHIKALLEGASGNPMAMRLLTSDWCRNGDLSLAFSLRSMSRMEVVLPSGTFSQMIDHTILALDQGSLAVAQFAAVLDERMNDLELYELAGIPLSTVMMATTQLTFLKILRTTNGRLHFCSHIVRARCYATIAGSLRTRLHSLIAERLITDSECHNSHNRLEIARHLVRADRLHDALPHIIAGGITSIRTGAADDADLALSTLLPTLSASSRCNVILALAEAKQEMGCWKESLELLDDNREDWSAPDVSRCLLLRALNDRFLGNLLGRRLEETIENILDIAEDDTEDLDVRAKAVSTSAALISSSRQPKHICRLGRISSSLMSVPMEDYLRIHVLHANAWYFTQHSGPSAALPLLLKGATLIERTQTANSIATRLLLGTGVSLCQIGQYSEASPILRKAHSIAKQLGNSALVANAASGLALVEGRLGNHLEQIEHALEAIRASGTEEWGICLLSAAYDRGLGLAAAGRASEAESAMLEFDGRFDKSRPAWIQQAWKLCKADVLALAGQDRKALQSGRIGTSGNLKTLHHDCFAGPYARWVAFSGIRSGTAAGALVRLECYMATLGRHDAKDQAEILASVAILEKSIGRNSTARWAEVKEKLGELPGPTQAIIRRLGLSLSTDASTSWGIRNT